ncbi:MAG: aminotransferase class V-fold PLP-dependent enzyme [Candidatus Micrarchaeota archaeon]
MDTRHDFPLLKNNPRLVYLDSACTSLKPRQVIDAEISYYETLGACGGRSSHRLGRKTSEMVGQAREKVASFAGMNADGLVWTKNATEGLNIVASGLDYPKRKNVVTTEMEHHSVLLPLIGLRDAGKITLEILKAVDGMVPESSWEAVDKETALIITHDWNNTTGSGQDVKKLARIAHDNGALICVDGAQGVPHHKSDYRDVDFLCFSSHKMLGPTGIGAIIAKDLSAIRPIMSGGGTVKELRNGEMIALHGHERFEAGVQHYAGIAGFAAACDYLKKIGMDKVESHERMLAGEMKKALDDAGAVVYGPPGKRDGALFSFGFKGARPHDIALMLDKQDIAVRSGFFCAQPAMEAMGAEGGAARASAYIYNTPEDVKRFGEALGTISALYR